MGQLKQLRLNPLHPEESSLRPLSIMDYRSGAIVPYEKAIRNNPNFYPASLNLSKILGEREIAVDRALTLARRIAELNPAAQAFDLLTWFYFKSGMCDEASRAIERTFKLNSLDPSIVEHREKIKRKILR